MNRNNRKKQIKSELSPYYYNFSPGIDKRILHNNIIYLHLTHSTQVTSLMKSMPFNIFVRINSYRVSIDKPLL